MKPTALALLSSGLDSSAATVLALKDYNVVSALTFDYGQRAAKQEILHAQKFCKSYNIEHNTLDVGFIFKDSNSALNHSESKLPQFNSEELNNSAMTKKSAAAVWVPNRNGLFINLAATLAESKNIDHIILGFNIEEATTFADNSEDFIKAINLALEYSTQNKIKVISPTSPLNKIEIVKKLVENGFDFSLLWSCYDSHTTHCGHCESCARLKRALTQNNLNTEVQRIFL